VDYLIQYFNARKEDKVMLKSKKNLVLLTALVVVLTGPLFGQTIPPEGSEGKLIAVIKSNASHKEQADACRQLSIIGTKNAVPALAELLGDEKLSHMARYGLEPIPDPAVDEALREALGKLKGRPLVGVIGSIGVRRDARAVTALAMLLHNPDPDVEKAASRALGSIGTSDAAKALMIAIEADSTRVNWLARHEGLLRCAENLAADGKRSEAIRIYDQLRKLDDAAHQVRGGALRGAILTRGNDGKIPRRPGETFQRWIQRKKNGVTLLLEQLRSDDYIMFSAAVQASQDLPGPDVTRVLTTELKKLPADNQILIIQTLGKRGDTAAVPTLSDLAKRGDTNVRMAAIKALPDIGDASTAPALAELMTDSDADISKAAQEALGSLPGREADTAVMAMLNSSDTNRQLKALEMIERRRMTKVSAALLKATRDDDESVRTASIRVLGGLSEEVRFPVLIELLVNAGSSSEIRAAERALSAACTREAKPSAGKVTIRRAVYSAIGEGGSADVTKKVGKIVASGSLSVAASNANFGDPAPGIPKQLLVEYTVAGIAHTKTIREGETLTLTAGATPEIFIDQLCSALAKAPIPQKLALLRILRVAQGPRALKAIHAATKDTNADVSSEAISVLCGWPTTDALPDVLELTRTATDNKVRILALRGTIRLIPLQDVRVQKKLAAFKEILPLVGRNEEKKLLLGALATVPAAEALSMVMGHLDNPAIKNETCFAAVAISEKIVQKNPREVADSLQKVLRATDNRDLTRRARKILNQAKQAAGR
jgi:HEAT repeat protein